MHRIEIELTTVTPAFIGTSDPDKRAEWAAKSVRGHLRWWLRAVLGGELHGQQDKVRKAEAEIFGSTKQKSAVKIIARPLEAKGSGDRAEGHSLSHTDLATRWGTSDPTVHKRLELKKGATNPIGYLGFGPITANRYNRARIHPNEHLQLLVQWERATPHLDSLRKALWCWLNLGGIGGRSRRGFGSLTCTSVRVIVGNEALIAPVDTLDKFKGGLRTHLGGAMPALPVARWSHFTSETKIYISTKTPDKEWIWEDALMAAGAWLIAFRRRYGASSDERGKDVQNHDYVWLKSNPVMAGKVPDRAGFGLPLPFGQGSLIAAWQDERGASRRRASPLLIHVARFGADHRLIFTHMPALLVPDGRQIHFRGTQSKVTTDQIGIVKAFLEDLKAKKKIEEIFP
jgi:CRISPR type III-B/RAMP module RAMP protein Cmr1